jgi:hypothetical protein
MTTPENAPLTDDPPAAQPTMGDHVLDAFNSLPDEKKKSLLMESVNRQKEEMKAKQEQDAALTKQRSLDGVKHLAHTIQELTDSFPDATPEQKNQIANRYLHSAINAPETASFLENVSLTLESKNNQVETLTKRIQELEAQQAHLQTQAEIQQINRAKETAGFAPPSLMSHSTSSSSSSGFQPEDLWSELIRASEGSLQSSPSSSSSSSSSSGQLITHGGLSGAPINPNLRKRASPEPTVYHPFKGLDYVDPESGFTLRDFGKPSKPAHLLVDDDKKGHKKDAVLITHSSSVPPCAVSTNGDDASLTIPVQLLSQAFNGERDCGPDFGPHTFHNSLLATRPDCFAQCIGGAIKRARGYGTNSEEGIFSVGDPRQTKVCDPRDPGGNPYLRRDPAYLSRFLTTKKDFGEDTMRRGHDILSVR